MMHSPHEVQDEDGREAEFQVGLVLVEAVTDGQDHRQMIALRSKEDLQESSLVVEHPEKPLKRGRQFHFGPRHMLPNVCN